MANHKNHADAQSTASMEAAQRELAYYLWERDGRPEGRSEFYWHQAAEELTRMPSGTTGAEAKRKLRASANGKGPDGAAKPAARPAAKPAAKADATPATKPEAKPRAPRKNATDAAGQVKSELAAAAAPKPRTRAAKPAAEAEAAPKAKTTKGTSKAKA
jgi:hypothetical protein